MKTIKTIATVTLSAIIAVLILQVSATAFLQILSLNPEQFLPKGAVMVGELGWINVIALFAHHGLMIYALIALKKLIKGFTKETLMSVAFGKTLTQVGIVAVIADLISSYTTSQMLGYIQVNVQLGVYLILAGFACEYARRYMVQKGLTF
ncbi:hypothetical protein [Streptococcus sp. S784/96/1]|uniref:hypothetical protein n=1 Tax=Streptococcus sp. S784/96/1 TaxID=2653499 RepID=UPI0013866907|nr:hypothetical protein [Streptococcus sp. S784/96/1]